MYLFGIISGNRDVTYQCHHLLQDELNNHQYSYSSGLYWQLRRWKGLGHVSTFTGKIPTFSPKNPSSITITAITYAILHYDVNNPVKKQVNLFFLSYFIAHLLICCKI